MTAMRTGISWCDTTWSPWIGCRPVSAGCDNCYARRLVNQDRFGHYGGRPFETVTLHLDRLAHVRRFGPIMGADGRLRPRLVFANSLSDPFFEQVPDAVIHRAFDAMERAPLGAIFQVLTKRPVRMRKVIADRYGAGRGVPSHLWLGVSVEDDRVAARAAMLARLQDRVGPFTAFLSVEPLIGPVGQVPLEGIAWVILGGESGPGARVMRREWLLGALDRVGSAGVATWLKQHGQAASHPDLHRAPQGLTANAAFRWLVQHGHEFLPEEKGGATVEGRTYRALPPSYSELTARLNPGRLLV